LPDPVAIVGPERSLQPGDVLADPVEQAGALLERGASVRRTSPVAEQPLEDDARVSLGGQGRGR
jgi:hypothetical protein